MSDLVKISGAEKDASQAAHHDDHYEPVFLGERGGPGGRWRNATRAHDRGKRECVDLGIAVSRHERERRERRLDDGGQRPAEPRRGGE